MALELKQTVGLSQQLIITPQLQQAIKLLQLSRLELLETVQQELVENPVLEELSGDQVPEEEQLANKTDEPPAPEGEANRDTAEEVGTANGEFKEPSNFDWENYIGTYNTPGSIPHYFPEDLPNYENTLTKTEDLQEHLVWQLHLSGFTPLEEQIGMEIIGNINDDGYLRAELSDIAEKEGWSICDIEAVLKKIQTMDPLGVGARNLSECLLLQLQLYENSANRADLTTLISMHLKLLEKKDYPAIARLMKIPVRRVYQLAKMISELEPKPGRPYGGDATHYITPDVYVHKIGSDYVVMLNEEGLPRLQVSRFYRNFLKDGDKPRGGQESTKEYIEDKLRSAMWLIKSIHQRQRTLYKVTKCIVKFQRDFLDKGVLYLRPMILRDVADEIGVHESTVSRATSNKYVHTPQGIFELKYFFNSGVSTGDGEESRVVAESVKSQLRQIVSAENPEHPYSDQEIVDLLKQSHVDVARRTVAKYREILGILPSPKRKQLF